MTPRVGLNMGASGMSGSLASGMTSVPSSSGGGTMVMEHKSTEQKLDEFYGVKQIGEDVVFRAKFSEAKKVLNRRRFQQLDAGVDTDAAEWTAGRVEDAAAAEQGAISVSLVVDGKWMTDPNNQYVEANQFGELNNIVEVD